MLGHAPTVDAGPFAKSSCQGPQLTVAEPSRAASRRGEMSPSVTNESARGSVSVAWDDVSFAPYAKVLLYPDGTAPGNADATESTFAKTCLRTVARSLQPELSSEYADTEVVFHGALAL